MLDVILSWFSGPIDALYDFLYEQFYTLSLNTVFFIEHFFFVKWGMTDLYLNIFGAAFTLLTLKLLYKLFNVYVCGIGGDNANNPLEYLKGYIQGIIISLSFTVLYEWLANAVTEIQQSLSQDIEAVVVPAGDNALLGSLFTIIYTIMILVLYVHILIAGCRLLVLRVGVPFACVGLIDGDNGVYTLWMKKIFQTAVTVFVQLLLIRLSMNVGFTGLDINLTLIAIALAGYSFRVTQDMNDIFLLSTSGGIGQKASSAIRSVGNLIMRH